MHRNGRYPDDLYSDAWNAQPYDAEAPSEPRRERHFSRQRRPYRRDKRRDDPNGEYNGDGPSSERSQSRHHDEASRAYDEASSRPYRSNGRNGYDTSRRYMNEAADSSSWSREHSHSQNGAYRHPFHDRRSSPSRQYAQNQGRNYSRDNSSANSYLWKVPSNSNSRSRSLSPPPPPIPTSPSAEYLAISLQPSSHCPQPSHPSPSPLSQHAHLSQRTSSPPPPPSAPRKLLILDLNGTLLVRLRASGPAYPRPYMPSFRDYLFAPQTRRWLDVMVWSSAQPHNVERMVKRCLFDPLLGAREGKDGCKDNGKDNGDGEDRKDDEWEGKLVAVWARDTLGLSKSNYTKKSKTTKDLAKPWSTLSSSGYRHSALTTFLLDDSPAKARLQPYNHICIHEYGKETLAADVEVKRRREGEREPPVVTDSEEVGGEGKEGKKMHKKDKKKKKKRQAVIDAALQQEQGAIPEHADAASPEDSTEFKNEDPSQSHYHDGPPEQEDTLRRASIPTAPDPSSPAPPFPTPELSSRLSPTKPEEDLRDQGEYESTLLAVIGILDALKYESNVAGWIRAGGLWGAKAPVSNVETTGTGVVIDGERAVSPTDLELEKEEGVNEEAEASVPPSSSPTSSQIKRQRSTASEGDNPGHWGRHDTKRTRLGWAAEDAFGADSNADMNVNADTSKEIRTGANKDVEAVTGVEETKMWFEDADTVQYWTERGRAALKELGIEERDGVCLEYAPV